MSEQYGNAGQRETFVAELGRVFADHKGVSEGYAICDLSLLTELMGRSFDEPVGLSRDDSGRLVTSSSGFPHPITDVPPERCMVYIPHPDLGGLGECIVYLTS
jgi:hypothetical protein